jgi:hypothetical protein
VAVDGRGRRLFVFLGVFVIGCGLNNLAVGGAFPALAVAAEVDAERPVVGASGTVPDLLEENLAAGGATEGIAGVGLDLVLVGRCVVLVSGGRGPGLGLRLGPDVRGADRSAVAPLDGL